METWPAFAANANQGWHAGALKSPIRQTFKSAVLTPYHALMTSTAPAQPANHTRVSLCGHKTRKQVLSELGRMENGIRTGGRLNLKRTRAPTTVMVNEVSINQWLHACRGEDQVCANRSAYR